MTVVVTPLDDLSFRFAVACAIDRIAAADGLRPDDLTPTPSLASRLAAELLDGYGAVRVTATDVLVVARAS